VLNRSFKFTEYDLAILEKFRIERLRSFFAQSLLHCRLSLNDLRILTIYCTERTIADNLLNEVEDLGDYAKLVLGAKAITIYFVEAEIYRNEIGSIRELSH
jgi:hypothetical protein